MIAVSSSGKSFRALAAYLANGRTGEEQDRVAWKASRNLPTDNPELGATFMRAAAARSDRIEKPVYHIALSFDPGDAVDRATMERVADRVLARLGLTEHQALIVAHRDRAHSHLHLLVNRVHTETGKAWERWKDQPVIQQVLREEERDLGLRQVPGRLAMIEPATEKPIPDRSPAGREFRISTQLRRLGRDLASYERVVDLARKQYAAQMAGIAAHARIGEIQAVAERARVAEASFREALGAVYRDPQEASRAFRELAESRGLSEAARVMRERPEELGRLVGTARSGPFAFGRSADERAARASAPDAARKGREAVEAQRTLGARLPDAEATRGQAERSAKEERAIREEMGRLPQRGELEFRVSSALVRLLPGEMYRLKSILTSPQAALVERLRATAREVILVQGEEPGS